MGSRMLVGLIGTNIQKSLAPALHEDAFAAAGVSGHYHLMDVSTLQGRRLEDLLAAARIAGFAGVNITHPFKEAVIPLLDAVSTEATEIGAVNTVVFDKSGRTTGHNTDCSGFRQAFIETFGADAVRSKPVLLLGAGGAGRAVAVALMALGASTVRIFDQDQARATGLCADLIMRFGCDRCELLSDAETAAASVAGIVNATPVGMTGYPGLPLPVRLIQKHHFVADVIYTPIDTKFVLAAQKKGCRTMNGGGMCVHQAVDAFRHFTGLVPDVARMKRTFETACAARDAASRREDRNEDSHRHGLPERRARRQAGSHRQRGLRACRAVRERPSVVQRLARRRAAHDRRLQTSNHHLPAVPRFRGHAACLA